MIAIRAWIILSFAFASCSLAAAADSGKPQIQGGNLRIEFDKSLGSRVVARFNHKETVLGPFAASETLTVADSTIVPCAPKQVRGSTGAGGIYALYF